MASPTEVLETTEGLETPDVLEKYVPDVSHVTSSVLTLTKRQVEGQALEQYSYDPRLIEQALILGDMKQMDGAMRINFYKAVCLSVGLNPLTQPFTVMERQDKTMWLYANASCTQQLAALHLVTFKDLKREHQTILGEPMYFVSVTACLPNGREVPSQSVVSLTKKRREIVGQWPSGDPKFRDVLDKDNEPVLVPLRGESLANAIMRCDTKALRRATLALVGLGWMLADAQGRSVQLNLQTGELTPDARLLPAQSLMDDPAERAKDVSQHIADLTGDKPQESTRQTSTAAPEKPSVSDTSVETSPIGTPIPDDAGHPEQQRGGGSVIALITTVHRSADRSDDWIRRYWLKMCKRFQVQEITELSMGTLLALLHEVRSYYQTEAEKANRQTSTTAPETPSTAETSQQSASQPDASGAPLDALASTSAASPSPPPETETESSTVHGADLNPNWRDELAALLPRLKDMTLHQEASSVCENPDATMVEGNTMLGRVLWRVEEEENPEDIPF
jgi:hypothetical protein